MVSRGQRILELALLGNADAAVQDVFSNYIHQNNDNNRISDNTYEDLQFHSASITSNWNEENGAIIMENVPENSNIGSLESFSGEVPIPVPQNLFDVHCDTNIIIEVLDVPEYNTKVSECDTVEEVSENMDQNDIEEAHDPEFRLTENSLESDSDSSPLVNDENDKNVTNTKKRRRKSEKNEWPREKTKNRRMIGLEYLGYTRDRQGKISQNKERNARKLRPTCASVKCAKYKNRFCNTITENERKLIFTKFWEELSWDQKKLYVSGLIEIKPTGRKYVQDSKRGTTYDYYLRVGNEKKQVCKKMFLSTLGLNEWMVANWCSKAENGMIPSTSVSNASKKSLRPQSARSRKVQEQSEHLNTFFENLPKMPSHYCRRDSKKLYLEYNFESKANLYRMYKEKCLTDQKIPLSSAYFSETFEKLNLAIFSPKKDQCNICMTFKAGNIEETEYKRHVELKDLARKVKDTDKHKSNEGLCHSFVMDVEAVKMCPVNNANKFYFKTRLKVHNFTIYNISNHECSNYWWNETEGDLSSSVFATIIIDHLTECCRDNLPIILWSDGCGYQNRNSILSNALLQYAVDHKKNVTQKYLEPGHTQMECDSVHSLIERKLKNKEIMLPCDYVRITREARQKPFPLVSKYMTHIDFRNYDDKELIRYKSIRPGRSVNDPTVSNLREIHYFPNGRIKYKIHFDDVLQDLPQRSREIHQNKEASKLFQTRLKIKRKKFNDLQDIKTTLDKDIHSFYDDLPYE